MAAVCLRAAGGGRRGPRAAPLAAGIRALAFLAAVRAAGAWRFGISLSLTGTLDPDFTRGDVVNTTCTYCPNVLVALSLAARQSADGIDLDDNFSASPDDLVNGYFGHPHGNVSWDVREDGSNLSACLANYVQMAQDRSIHALLGPAYAAWNHEVEEAVAPYGKVLIKWSFDIAVYPNKPNSRYVIADYQTFLNSEFEARDRLPPPPPVSMSTILPDDANASGAASSRFSFDVNIPQRNWMYDVIDSIGWRNKTFMFLWFNDFPGSSYYEEQCVDAFRYVLSHGGSATILPMHFYSHFSNDLGAVLAVNPGALGFCGHDYAFQHFLISAEARVFSPDVFFVGQPIGETPLMSQRAYVTNYLVEPIPISPLDLKRPDPLFGDLLHFWQAWWDAAQTFVPYEAYQVIGATSLLLESLHALAGGPGNFTSAALAAQIRRSRTATVIGWLSFDANGERAPGPDAKGSMRQILPLPGSFGPLRFLISSMVVVSSVAKESCDGLLCRQAFEDRITVWTGGWQLKLLQVMPCAPGCKFEQLACLPCPTGTYRGATDATCKQCESGHNTYSDVPGAETCSQCPDGADCSNPAGTPLPKPSYCRVQPWTGSCAPTPPQFTRLQSGLFDNSAFSGPTIECVKVSDTPALRYQHCLPARVCQGGAQTCIGSNRGMLCGQCGPGETYHGLHPGRRRCQACPSSTIVILRIVGIAMFYLLVGFFMSRLSERAAACQNFLPCAMFRSFVHYMHLMACVCELTRLDANPVVSWIVTPLDLFWRPMELAQVSCLNEWTEQRLEQHVFKRHEILLSLGMAPIGIAFLLWIHLIASGLLLAWAHVRHWVCGFAQAAQDQVLEISSQATDAMTKTVVDSMNEALLLDADPAAEGGQEEQKTAEGSGGQPPRRSEEAHGGVETAQAGTPKSEAPPKSSNIEDPSAASPVSKTPTSEASASPQKSAKEEKWPSEGSSSPKRKRSKGSKSSSKGPTSLFPGLSPSNSGQQSQHSGTIKWADEKGERLATVGKSPSRRSQRGSKKEEDGGESSEPTLRRKSSFRNSFTNSTGMSQRMSKAEEKVEREHEIEDLEHRFLATLQGKENEEDSPEAIRRSSLGSVGAVGADEPPDILEFARKEQFAKNGVTARKFMRSHDFRNLRRKMDNFWREFLVLVLLVYPQSIRTLMLLSNCIPLGTDEWDQRFVIDLDVKCSTLHQVAYENWANVLLVSAPLAIGALLCYHALDMTSLKNRRVMSVLTSGYKPEAFYWEIIHVFQIGVMVRMMSIRFFSLRYLLMTSALIGFFCLNLVAQPYEAHGRWALDRFERASSIGVIMAVGLGVLLQEEVDDTIGTDGAQSVAGVYYEVAVVLWNVWAVIVALFRSLVVELCIDLEVIVNVGGSLSWTLDHMTRFISWSYGIHPVIYYKDSVSGKEILDASRLNSRERRFLVFSLTDTVSACLDSNKEFHTRNVERAIHEALQRAKQARAAKMANYYYTYGQRTRTIGWVPCFETALPDPDVDLVDDKTSNFIYVEELHVALRDVNGDVMEHVGHLQKRVADDDEKSDSSEDHDHIDISTWGQGDGLKNLEQELAIKGSLVFRHRQAGDGQDDDQQIRQQTTGRSKEEDDASSASASDGHPEDMPEKEFRTLMRDKACEEDLEEEKERHLSEEALRRELEQLQEEVDWLEMKYLEERQAHQNQEKDVEIEVKEQEEEGQFPALDKPGKEAEQKVSFEWEAFTKNIHKAWSSDVAWRGFSHEGS